MKIKPCTALHIINIPKKKLAEILCCVYDKKKENTYMSSKQQNKEPAACSKLRVELRIVAVCVDEKKRKKP